MTTPSQDNRGATQIDLEGAIQDAMGSSPSGEQTAELPSQREHRRRIRELVEAMLPRDRSLPAVGGTIESVEQRPATRFDVSAVVELSEPALLSYRCQLDVVGSEPTFYEYRPGDLPVVEVAVEYDDLEYSIRVVVPAGGGS